MYQSPAFPPNTFPTVFPPCTACFSCLMSSWPPGLVRWDPEGLLLEVNTLRLWLVEWFISVCVLCQAHCSAGFRALQDTYLMRRLWLCNCKLLWELLWEMYFRGAKQPLLQQNRAMCEAKSHCIEADMRRLRVPLPLLLHTDYVMDQYILCLWVSLTEMLHFFLLDFSSKASFIEASCLHQESSNNLWSYQTVQSVAWVGF